MFTVYCITVTVLITSALLCVAMRADMRDAREDGRTTYTMRDLVFMSLVERVSDNAHIHPTLRDRVLNKVMNGIARSQGF